jgi:tRNA(fMet)-specific endonuclease VapC
MNQALLDSDTLSFYFKGNPKVIQKIDGYLTAYGFVHISVITFYEILNGLLFKDARAQLQRFQQFVQLNQILPVNVVVAEVAAKIYADLRRNNQMIGHNDVLIGATAIENDLTLITNNINHFSRIPGLSLDNWAI